MSGINKMLNQFLGGSAAGGFAGGLAGGLTSSMLTNKKGRKLGKKALKMGGMAAVGAIAYGAFQKYKDAKSAPQQAGTPVQPELQPAPSGSSFMPADNDTAAREQLGLVLVRAMIAAARSDGNLDAKESQTIFQRIQTLDLAQEDKNLLVEEMGRPVNIDAIVNAAATPEIAAEIYVASLLAIDVDTVEEKSYLDMLAARMKLPQELVIQLNKQVENQLE